MTYRSQFVDGLARLDFRETRDRLVKLRAAALARKDAAAAEIVSNAESAILLAYRRAVEEAAAALDALDGVPEEAAPTPVAKAGPVLPGRIAPRVPGSPVASAPVISPVRTPPRTSGGLGGLSPAKTADTQPEPTVKAGPVKAPFKYPPKPPGYKPLGPAPDDDDIPW